MSGRAMGCEVSVREVDGGDTWYDVTVPTERGDKCIITFHREPWDVWVFRVTGEMFELAPEAVTAAVQMAFLALREAAHSEHGGAA